MKNEQIASLEDQTSGLNIQDDTAYPSNPFLGYEQPPPTPKINSRGITATDITAHFIKASEKLSLGQLIKDEYFTLFESVGAIELMDPKMDTGYLAEGETMSDDYDVGQTLLPEEILGVMDQLLCFEMAWHMGHPLAQTLFTSLYIDHLFSGPGLATIQSPTFGKSDKSIEVDPLLFVLRVYCLALVKTCWHVNNRVKSEHYYEEEDFVTHTYNRDLLEHVEDNAILELLDKASRSVDSLEDHVTAAIQIGLLIRLTLRRDLMVAIIEADERSSTNVKSHWTEAAKSAKLLKDAHDLGKPVPSSFSVKLQRKLASTVPPRPVVSIAFEAALAHLEALCKDGCTAAEVLEYHDSQSLITFVALFQARKPAPSVFIRTLLQHYVFGDMIILGKHSIRQILDDDLESMILPNDPLLDRLNDEIEVPHDPRHQMAENMETFRSRAAQSYLDILRTFCQNRSRVRRTLHHAIADWDNLQLDSEDLDIELRNFTKETPISDPSFSQEPVYSFPLSSWSYFYKLRCMEWSIQMGFELEVYQPWELAGMYWYLQYLISTRIRHLERIRMFVMHKFSNHQRISKRPDHQDLTYNRSLSFLNFTMLEATATSGLSDALSTLYAVLLRLSVLKTPQYPYADSSIRYELRMKPFVTISLPELIPFPQFQANISASTESTSTLLAFASEAAGRAKKDFELLGKLDEATARYKGSANAWRGNLKDTLRAVIVCSIGIAMVGKAIEKKEVEKLKVEIPETGKRYHDWWIVPKISMGG